MTEKYLIDFLSAESEKMDCESFDEKNRFDTDICGWKDITPQQPTNLTKDSGPPRFRIRTVARKGSLSRSNSSMSYLSTISSGNSTNNSPGRDHENSPRKRKNIVNVAGGFADPGFLTGQIGNIKIHEPPKPRKTRKPIKVFKLPNVNHQNDE